MAEQGQEQQQGAKDFAKLAGTVAGVVRGPNKDFGFISPDDGGQQLFFHRSACESEEVWEGLKPGHRVLYIPLASDRGPRAVGVERV